jgi:hypothetical protein
MRKAVLQDMGHRGNVAAATLKDELDELSKLAANASSTSSRSTHISLFRRPLVMAKDAETLNRAILSVIEITQLPDERSENELSQAQASNPVTAYEGSGPLSLAQDLSTAMQNSPWMASALPGNRNLAPPDELYPGNFGTAGGRFDVDVVGSDWLDFV